MKINQILRESANGMKTLALMPGRFQPPHIGHLNAWKSLNANFDEAFIVTSDKVDPPRSPFDFAEKKRLFEHAGVPIGIVQQVKNPYTALEVTNSYDKENTVVIFGVSEKDMTDDPRFAFKPKKDGSPGYLQPFPKSDSELKPMSQHGYVTTIPTFNFDVLGKPMRSATEVRAQFSDGNKATQKQIIIDLYGSYDESIHHMMRQKLV